MIELTYRLNIGMTLGEDDVSELDDSEGNEVLKVDSASPSSPIQTLSLLLCDRYSRSLG